MAWCTIESDPGVFNEMLWNLGIQGAAVEEIYSLEQAEQQQSYSYGLIFLFKWRDEPDPRPVVSDDELDGLIFSRQMITDACATQAILSVVLNVPELDIGDEMNEFKAFMSVLDCESRGLAISNNDRIRDVHNSFARAEPFLNEQVKAANAEKEDAHHFIAFLPFNGKVYELDGLKAGPILIGNIPDGGDWLNVVKPVLEQRMARLADDPFTLLALKPRRSLQLQQEIAILQSQMESLSIEQQAQLVTLQQELDQERSIAEAQRQENIRRRHNYVPMIVTLLRHLAAQGKLQPLITQAKDRQATRAQTAGGSRK
jgi:ubiquitin carboxyl-terminal hydrolase L5